MGSWMRTEGFMELDRESGPELGAEGLNVPVYPRGIGLRGTVGRVKPRFRTKRAGILAPGSRLPIDPNSSQ